MARTLPTLILALSCSLSLAVGGCSGKTDSPAQDPAASSNAESESSETGDTSGASGEPQSNTDTSTDIPSCSQSDDSWALDYEVKSYGKELTASEAEGAQWAKKFLLEMVTNPAPGGESIDDTTRTIADYEFARQYMTDEGWEWLETAIDSGKFNMSVWGVFPQTRTNRGTVDPITGEVLMSTQGMGCPEYSLEKFNVNESRQDSIQFGIYLKTRYLGINEKGEPSQVTRMHQIILHTGKVNGEWKTGWNAYDFPTYTEVSLLD